MVQGAWTDPTTGIAYHRARWYDPRTASWLSEDPEGDVDSPNLYAFVAWGPHRSTDPSGRLLSTDGCPANTWPLAVDKAIVCVPFAEDRTTRVSDLRPHVALPPIRDLERFDPAVELAGFRAEWVRERHEESVAAVTNLIVAAAGATAAQPIQGNAGPVAPEPIKFGRIAPYQEVAPRVAGAGAAWFEEERRLYTEPELVAHERSVAIQKAVPENTRGRITMSASVVEEEATGIRRVAVGTSERRGYLRPGVKDALKPGEVVVPGLRHAESDIVRVAKERGWKVISVGAGRPHCEKCVAEIEEVGATTASPRRQPRASKR